VIGEALPSYLQGALVALAVIARDTSRNGDARDEGETHAHPSSRDKIALQVY
jgi:hypothetical protein